MANQGSFPSVRMRRLRKNKPIRRMMTEVSLSVNDLIFPLFIHHGQGVKQPIASMPGCFQYSIDQLPAVLAELVSLGIPSVLLFGIPAHKDNVGSDACDTDGVIASAIKMIKKEAPSLWVIADLCYCEYTDHGHCGVIDQDSEHSDVDNDATLALLAEQAVVQAQAGADCVAPSGMMDGMVQAVRAALDEAQFQDVAIISYAVKYASALYGPFREAAQGAPQFGDRRGYQMDPANACEACREADLDVAEGCDMLMVKPALSYLDVVSRLHDRYPEVPVVAYQVSGEYAMIKAAAMQAWLDEKAVVLESLLSMKRAGARCIITYFAKDVAQWLCVKDENHGQG